MDDFSGGFNSAARLLLVTSLISIAASSLNLADDGVSFLGLKFANLSERKLETILFLSACVACASYALQFAALRAAADSKIAAYLDMMKAVEDRIAASQDALMEFRETLDFGFQAASQEFDEKTEQLIKKKGILQNRVDRYAELREQFRKLSTGDSRSVRVGNSDIDEFDRLRIRMGDALAGPQDAERDIIDNTSPNLAEFPVKELGERVNEANKSIKKALRDLEDCERDVESGLLRAGNRAGYEILHFRLFQIALPIMFFSFALALWAVEDLLVAVERLEDVRFWFGN